MADAYTPGPWDFDPWNGLTVRSGARLLVDGVALPTGNHARIEEAEANSRLIAAAPDLLAALRLAINSVECASIDAKTGEELPWYRAAKGAIAKATATPEIARARRVAGDRRPNGD